MKDNLILLNEQQWNLLKQAAPHFESARHEYIRNAPRWLTQQVIDVYEAATDRTIHSKDLSCAVCVLNIYKQASGLYFYNLEERKKLESQDDDTGSESKKGIAKSKTGNKKKKE